MHPVLEAAVEAMKNVDSFHFEESWEETFVENRGTTFRGSGDFQAPNRMYKRGFFPERSFGSIPGNQGNEVQSISIGNSYYLTDPVSGEWIVFDDALRSSSPQQPLDALFESPIDFFEDALAEGGSFEYEGITTLDGVQVHKFVSTTRKSAYAGRASRATRVGIWVRVADSLVMQVTRGSSVAEGKRCGPNEVCTGIRIVPGGSSQRIEFSYSGKGETVQAPQLDADTISSSFGPMALFKNIHVPFSIQYPDSWVRKRFSLDPLRVLLWDGERNGGELLIKTDFTDEVSFKAQNGWCFDGTATDSMIGLCSVVKRVAPTLAQGELTAEEYTDYWIARGEGLREWSLLGRDLESLSRQEFRTESSLETEVVSAGVTSAMGSDVYAIQRLTYVHKLPTGHPGCSGEAAHCYVVINVNYKATVEDFESLREMIEHSFGTLRVEDE